MAVGDDHDLIIRTYLAGAKFAHTGTVGYLYRVHGENTVIKWNQAIQEQQSATCRHYIHKLIDEWLRRTGHLFVDLSKDLKHDGNGGPLIRCDNDTVGCVRAYGESLPCIPQKQVSALMHEIYRVLVPGGWLCCQFPSTEGTGAFAPHYNSYWNAHVFDYYSDKKYADRIPGNKCRFQLVRNRNFFPDNEATKKGIVRTDVDLSALKGQRQPGRVFI